jgi:hypothetical protein
MNLPISLYYLVKPVIPRPVRMALRRTRATALRRSVRHRWPIDEASAAVPAGWSGWPAGKRFAFVLTHDVEGVKGLKACNALARLEETLGFRSSFNFVPEGEYAVPCALRADLAARGFEVGVHDLHHDGSLYRSIRSFGSQAVRINHYLKDWGAVGFRAGFMFHNLDWLRKLDVLYDASTFDADPFEPQPDGVNTIFPFWVARADQTGYVELPYTLAQDSTLFLVLCETTIDVWTRKLDWVASRGGMALVNVHPDYMRFDGRGTRATYPAKLYADLLQYVKDRYEREAWMALPRDVARYVAEQPRCTSRVVRSLETVTSP